MKQVNFDALYFRVAVTVFDNFCLTESAGFQNNYACSIITAPSLVLAVFAFQCRERKNATHNLFSMVDSSRHLHKTAGDRMAVDSFSRFSK